MHVEGNVALALALAISMYCIACGRKRGEERRGGRRGEGDGGDR
jgi:hypothetical protein